MKTKSADKIERAKMLLNLIEQRKEIEKMEQELKDYFKSQITDGILEAGDVMIMIEEKSRSSLDRKALEMEMGLEKIKKFEKVTFYSQVNVTRKSA